MTTGPNRIFDDFAKLMTDAAGAAQGMRREAETMFQAQAEKFLASMDLVQREEFEAMKEAALAASARAEALAERVDALEARITKLEGT
ncbi:MAG: accessory factor UbiK family protein [Roseitalea sp.]|jgi:BMFP domain-containing protein YqiC|nr:accessory factor UbiK family protein [Roseitalea sp.]MBO6723130.1 accessory factor UbiK family protein [Roseitalea sp.]MBO6742432.1 accessory factor UbiK family protein [Roseitalea sp.]